jgi:S1-C subfamily serine protease
MSSRRLPVSILQVSAELPTRIPPRAASRPQPGDWVVAVWETDRAPAFAAASFRQSATIACGTAKATALVASISMNRAMIGGAIFNMDRELLGVILPCDDGVAAIEPSSVDEMLKRVATLEERLLALHGVLFSRLEPDERGYFSGTDGVLVREVWMGTRGEAAGLQPGDVVVALNERTVVNLDDLQPLTKISGDRRDLKVRRGADTQVFTLAGTPAPEAFRRSEAGIGVVIASPTPAYPIDTVLSDSRAARAGVRAGDVLRRINRVEPRTRAQAERAVKSAISTPILLEVERDDRRIAIVIPQDSAR